MKTPPNPTPTVPPPSSRLHAAHPHPTLQPCLPGILPRCSVNLLAGAPAVGKTALIASMAVWFRDQLPIFGHQPNPVPRQILISADRSWEESTVQWFTASGFPDMEAYSVQDDDTFKKVRLRKKLERMKVFQYCLDQFDPIPPGTLVWVDPISLFLGGNLNDYDTCAVACSEIREICKRLGITVCGLAHAGKQKADSTQRYLRLQDRIAGSVALFGYTDTQMYLAGREEIGEPYHVFHWCPHHAPAASFKLSRLSNGLFGPYDDPDAGREVELLDLIPTSPTLIGARALIDLGAERALSRATCYRFLEVLRERGQVVKIGHGHYTRSKAH